MGLNGLKAPLLDLFKRWSLLGSGNRPSPAIPKQNRIMTPSLGDKEEPIGFILGKPSNLRFFFWKGKIFHRSYPETFHDIPKATYSI